MVFCATVADASSQSTDFSGEMVPGVEKTAAPEDGNNGDGTRGGKVCPGHVADSVLTCSEYPRKRCQMIVQAGSEVPGLSF